MLRLSLSPPANKSVRRLTQQVDGSFRGGITISFAATCGGNENSRTALYPGEMNESSNLEDFRAN